MTHAIRRVETREDREALYAFRYRVYVEEFAMTTVADHERKWLYDDLDQVVKSTTRCMCSYRGSGIADVVLNDPSGPPIAVIGAGDTFGEIGFLTRAPRTASVVARSHCQVLVISTDFMERFIAKEPAVGAKLLLNLSRELASRLTVANHRNAEPK